MLSASAPNRKRKRKPAVEQDSGNEADDPSESNNAGPLEEGAEVENNNKNDDTLLTPSYSTSVHYRQTRKRGKIIKQVTERYVRSDLGFGITYTDHGEADHNDNDDDHQTRSNTNNNKLHSQVDQVVGRPTTIPSVEDLLQKCLISTCQPYALVVVDTNVLLHNLDVLERAVLGDTHSSPTATDRQQGSDSEGTEVKKESGASSIMPNIVIPQTALQECRSNRMTAYDRTVDLLRSVKRRRKAESSASAKGDEEERSYCPIFFPDQNHAATASQPQRQLSGATTATSSSQQHLSPNDENDARIRKVARYFAQHTRGTGLRVVLLTDDKACRVKAQEESGLLYEAHSVASWVQILERANPHVSSLSDLVANVSSAPSTIKDDEAQHNQKHCTDFSAHLEAAELSVGIQQGKYQRGVFRVASQSANGVDRTGSVTIRQGDERVAVTILAQETNRAIDGDVVAVALNSLQHWISPTSTTTSTQKNRSGERGSHQETGIIASETADPTPADLDNVKDNIALPVNDNNQDVSLMRPTGRVVGVIRRNFASYSGSIYETARNHDSSSTKQKVVSDLSEREEIASQYEREHADGTCTCVFFAVDRKVPPILLRTTQRDRLLGQRIIVAMDSWPVHSTFPLGHYVRTIGPAGSKDVETQVLLQEHRIPHEPFPAAVLACLPPEDYKIGADNSPGRLDLRHLPVLSIDPPGCKDIDDALHCMKLPNGNYQIGVHIADVTHYVKPNTAIDLEAANRSTSTYLVNKRLDMLPGLLTTDLCSLKGNVDRYAFSVLWEVTQAADIVDVEFHKSLIHSIGALTYQQAQSLIDQPEDPKDVQACAVKGLAELARKFRKRRIDAGALTLASPEVKFVLDSESLNPTDVQAYALLEANAVVEEFMLLANVTVSKKILRHYPTLSVLRRHPAPNRAMFDSLISKARSKGLAIEIDDSKKLADSLDAAQVESDPYINKLLRILSTRCMSPAQYFCSGEFPPTEWHHYGLAAPVYTHFTSPIRRYADVCVHRLLAAAINVAPLPPHLSSKSYLHDLCANMNRRHRSAQMAGRASVQLHTLIFFAGDGAKEEFAYVLDVDTAEASDPCFNVIVPRYGIEGKVRLPIDPLDTKLSRFPEEHKLTYELDTGSKATIQVFDKVKVRIWVRETQDHRRELLLDLLEPYLGTTQKENESNDRQRKKARFGS